MRDGEAVQDTEGQDGQPSRLAGLADILDRFLLILVTISAGAGVAFPGLGRHVDAGGAILDTLAVLVFCTGASMTFREIAAVRTASRRLVLVLAVSTVTLAAGLLVASTAATVLLAGPILGILGAHSSAS
jgi:uncharacterized membrane protein YbjE (DUF340 family)